MQDGETVDNILERRAGRQPKAPEGVVARPRVTAASAIYDDLYNSIVNMHLPPATPLQERALTERFGVSKTPMREALARLADDGLVSIFPQSGTYVSRIPVAAIPEAMVIRQTLEDTAVKRAAEIATAEDIALLDLKLGLQRAVATVGDTDRFHEADEAFHEAIILIAGYPSMSKLLRQIKVQINRARRLTLPVPGRMQGVINDHVVIRDAIASHDIEGARDAMKTHLGIVVPDVDRLRKDYPNYFV